MRGGGGSQVNFVLEQSIYYVLSLISALCTEVQLVRMCIILNEYISIKKYIYSEHTLLFVTVK